MGETFTSKQNKFNNGEISSLSFGDQTNPKFPASLKTCLNWIPTPQGALVKRPAFAFVAPVKDAAYAPKLMPFFFSDDQTFMVELGNLYARFYQRSKYVGNDGALHSYGDAYGGGYYEIITPFTTAMLPYLTFWQVGNVITICYGGQSPGTGAISPYDLRHTVGALTPWTLGATPTQIPAGVVTWNTPMVDAVQPWSAVISYQPGDRVSVVYVTGPSTGKVEWVSIQSDNLNNPPPAVPAINAGGTGIAGNIWWVPATDLSHQASALVWCETLVVQDTNGVVYESAPSAELPLSCSLSLDRPKQFVRATFTLAPGYTALFERVYRKTKNGAYGWLFDHPMTTPFQDDGRTPDYTKQPPTGVSPFLVGAATSYPSVIGYLDQRRLFAAPALLPSSLIFSKVGDLYNYDARNVPGADTDAFLSLLSSPVLEQIRAFMSKKRGIILTAQGEWLVAGQGGGPVSKSNIDAKQQSSWGSSWVRPLSVGTGLLFVTGKNNTVRDFFPLHGIYTDNWDGQDLTAMSRDLFNLTTIVNWAFQSVPYPVAWAVRSDGALLSLTYQHAPPSFGQQLTDGVVAWARHVPGQSTDKFEEICVVPEPPDDAVYCVVKRQVLGATVRYIERMDSPVCPASPYAPGVSDVRYGRYLDAAVTYDGHNDKIGYTGVPVVLDSVDVPGSVDPLDYAINSTIKLTIAGGPFVASDADVPYGSGFVFDPENLLGLGKAKAHLVGFTSTGVVTAQLDTALTQAQVTAFRAGCVYWGIAKAQFAATHIWGYALDSAVASGARGIICLADGDVQIPVGNSLASGVLKLDTPALVIHAGLAYNADVAMLDVWHPSAELRNRLKNIIRVGFEVAGARDMWVGKDFTDLSQWEQREVLDAYGVMGLATGYFEQFVEGGWTKGSSGVLRHFQPLPAALVSVLREVHLGDT